MEPMREKIAAALTVVLFLAICAMIMTGCSRREQPIARQSPAEQPPIDSSREVAKEVPPTHPTIPEQEFERRFAETFERASRPPAASTLTPEEQRRLDAHRQGRKEVLDAWKASVATDTTQPLRRAPVHVVHFAEVATPLNVFRVVDHPAMTIDGMTYQPSRFAFVAIDIAETMRDEHGCLFVDWQSRLTTGSCYWPATWARGKWMVIPVDTSPVVQFRRRSGANILPAMKIADLPTISAAELK